MTDTEKLLARLTGFTPGPWWCHFGSDDCKCNCKYVLAEYGGMGSIATIDVCESMDAPWGDDSGPDAVSAKANAALIAAAPDLHRIATAQAAEIERLRYTLKFYAPSVQNGITFAGRDDGGKRATAALAVQP